jgi:mannonate dehydratase
MGGSSLMEEGLRWFGPGDPVPLAHLRQAGAAAVFSALHEIPYGEVWPREAIRKRRAEIEAAGLSWKVIESIPVHESIKVGDKDRDRLLANYAQSVRNAAAEAIRVVVYNFMPVLDWVRTDMRWVLPNGAESMRFDPVRFAAFEIHALKRRGAEGDYSAEQIAAAGAWWKTLDTTARESFVQTIIDVFPGCKLGLGLEDIRGMLARYEGMSERDLAGNLGRFLEVIGPVAEEAGVRLAIHPDDPPFSVLGLPRIVSTSAHLEAILKMTPSAANGICFCTGSLGARRDNDLVAMVKRFGPRIHGVHLRSTQLESDGSFYEAEHLGGSVDMAAVVRALLEEQDRRRGEGRDDWQLVFRPDHGHRMMDDLGKPMGITPGYSGIGRMKGLSELRGLMRGLRA